MENNGSRKYYKGITYGNKQIVRNVEKGTEKCYKNVNKMSKNLEHKLP